MALDFPASPTNGQLDPSGQWTYNSTKQAWQSVPLTQAKTVTSSTPPSSPQNGDQWFNTNDGTLYIYYTDANSSQWVESRAPITADGYISPNYLINGGFDIWQRSTAISGTYQNKTFVADRWWGFTGTSATSFNMGQNGASTYDGLPNALYVIRNVGNTSLSPFYLGQDIETNNSRLLAGKTVTLSFYARKGSAFAGTLGAAIRTGTGTDQSMTSGYTGSVTIISQNIESQLPTSGMSRVSVTATVPSNASQVGVVFTYTPSSATAVANENFIIAGVQLEEGTTATAFRRNSNSIQGELAACQRYFVAYEANSIRVFNPYFSVNLGSGDQFVMNSTFPVPMRRTPDNPTTTTGALAHSFTYFPSTAATNGTISLKLYPYNSQSFKAAYSSSDNGGNLLSSIYASGLSNNAIWVNAEL